MQGILEIISLIAILVYLIGWGILLYHLIRFGVWGKQTFDGKKSYEHVLLLMRRHWFVLAVKLAGFLLIGLIPAVARMYVSEVAYFWPAVIVFYLLWCYGLFYAITMYLLDVWIVTDHRVIDSEQHGFFNRSWAELSLYRIQDISVEIGGMIPTFLNFGYLEIQTAGTTEKFSFQQIPDPNGVKDEIFEAHNQFVKLHPDDVEIHEP